MDNVTVILARFYSMLELKLNNKYEHKVQTFSLILKIFTSKSSEQCNYGIYVYVATRPPILSDKE